MPRSLLAAAALMMACAAPVHAQLFGSRAPSSDSFSGYLCCNMRTDGSWISDSNYAESGKKVIPVGTPVTVTGYGRNRAYVEIEGAGKQALGNDYSRDLSQQDFARRYVVAEDPRLKMQRFPQKIQRAISTGRIVPGMTREQVLMAVGYPISSENPNLDAKVWRMWLSSFSEFQVVFDDKGLVRTIETDPQTRNLVVMD